jgi:hypothetical protein
MAGAFTSRLAPFRQGAPWARHHGWHYANRARHPGSLVKLIGPDRIFASRAQCVAAYQGWAADHATARELKKAA